MLRKVHVFQNVIPLYRKEFFDSLNSNNYKIKLWASNRNELGIESVELDNLDYDNSLKLYNIGSRVMWQSFSKALYEIKKGDIVVLSGNPRLLSNYVIVFLSKILGFKTICWSHGWTAGSHGLFSKIRIKSMSLFNGVLLYTDKEVELFKLKNLCNKPMFYLNNGLNYDRLVGLRKKGFHDYNKKDKTKLIYCGRLTEKSNIILLLTAMIKLENDFQLKIVGDGELFSTCEDFIHKHNLKNVTMMGKVFDEDILSELYADSDVFVYPGKVGLSLIHAFCYGLPAILHDKPEYQMPEYAASNTQNTIYFNYENVESLVSALKKFHSCSVEDIHDMRYEADRVVREKYNTKEMVSNFLNMVENV